MNRNFNANSNPQKRSLPTQNHHFWLGSEISWRKLENAAPKAKPSFFEGLPLLQYYNSALAGEIGYRKLEAEVNLPKNDDFAFAAAFFNHFTFEP